MCEAIRRITVIGALSLVLGAALFFALARTPRESGMAQSSTVQSVAPIERRLEEGEAEVALAEPASSASASQRIPIAATGTTPTAAGAAPGAPQHAQPVLMFRLLDPAGNALAEHEVRTRFDWTVAGAVSGSVGSMRTDGDGRGSFALDGPRGPRTTSTLELRTAVLGGELAGRIELKPPLSTGGGDVGDIVLHECALLVEGRVVDERGEPVRFASVLIQSWDSHSWTAELFVKPDAGGHFAAYGEASGNELRLSANARAFSSSEPLGFRRGASGLVVVLPRGGQVVGSLRIPEGTARGDFELSLEERAREGTYTRSATASGRFHFDELRTGTFDLRVRYLPSRRLVAAVEGLEVRAGVACADPRLEEIELSQDLRPIHVRVRCASGAPATGTIHQLFSLPEERIGKRIVLQGGTAVLASFGEPLELAVAADGFRVVRLSGVVADQELTVREPASTVRVALADLIALPPDGAKLVLELQRSSVTPNDPDSWWNAQLSKRQRIVGGPREWTLAIQLPGAYDVRFLLQHGTDATLAIPARSPIVVDEVPGEQRFVVTPEPETYALALATLR